MLATLGSIPNRASQQATHAAAKKRSAEHLSSTVTGAKRSCGELRGVFEPGYLEGQSQQVAEILRNNARRQLIGDLPYDGGEAVN